MNPNEIEIYEVVTEERVEVEMRRFVRKKRFYSLPAQIKEIVENFMKGHFEGDKILAYDKPMSIEVYKLRLPNPDANAGKSGGYRVIYAIAVEHKLVVLLSIYYKKEIENISDHEIRGMINAFIANHLPEQSETVDGEV